MFHRFIQKESVSATLAGVEMSIRRLRECADANPPLKSAVSTALAILEMSRVSTYVYFERTFMN